MLTTPVSLVLLAASLALFTVVGLRAHRHGRRGDLTDYVLAPGSQGAGPLGLSFVASGLGAWILFAPPELGATLGVTAVVGYALAGAAPFVVLAFVGPRIRRLAPSGRGLTEVLRVRFGAGASSVVALVSLLYMAVFVAAELVAVAGIGELLGGVPRPVTVLAIVAATLVYTTFGGLRASLRTDRWQSWLVIALLVAASTAVVTGTAPTATAVADSGLVTIQRAGIEAAGALLLALTAANLLHHGYWQRVWAARDERALRRGALLGAAISVPLLLLAGGAGVLAAALGVAEVPALSLFALLAELPGPAVAAVLVLGIGLVTSSIDTLENGLVALLVAERPAMRLVHARVATVALMLPAVGVSLVATSVLQLFLIADLLAAALIVPALLGLWRRATAQAVRAGALAGLLGAFGAGWLATGTLGGAVAAVTFPDAVPTLPPFAGAVVASGVVATVVSLSARRITDPQLVDEAIRARTAATAGAP